LISGLDECLQQRVNLRVGRHAKADHRAPGALERHACCFDGLLCISDDPKSAARIEDA
jgi:hypothetical protein